MPHPIRDAAKLYHSLGWNVLEVYSVDSDGCTCFSGADCRSPGKHPVATPWQSYLTLPEIESLDLEDSNLGLSAGATDCQDPAFIVLDIDCKNGKPGLEALKRWDERGLPQCPRAESGSGGVHLFFAYPRNPDGTPVDISSHIDFVPGVDIRGRGAYVVAAPSSHSSGAPYRWLTPPETPLPPLPGWLLSEMLKDQPLKDETAPKELSPEAKAIKIELRHEWAEFNLAKIPAAVEGRGGDLQTFKAGSIGHAYGIEQDDFFPLLCVYNNRCVPPWDLDDLRKKMVNGYTHNDRVFGWRLEERIRANRHLSAWSPWFENPTAEALCQWFIDVHCNGWDNIRADGSAWMRYVDVTGVWQRLPKNHVRGALQALAMSRPETRGKNDGAIPFNITEALFQAAVRWIEATQFQEAMFDSVSGFAQFRDACVKVVTNADGSSEVKIVDPDPLGYQTVRFDCDILPPLTPEETEHQKFWDTTLREIWAPNHDVEERIKLFQEFVGACVLGIAPRFKKCLVMLGTQADNGKSMLMKVITGLFPGQMIGVSDPNSWTGSSGAYNIAELRGKRINWIGELEEKFFESKHFKQMIAGDETLGRPIYERPFRFCPIAGHVFATNNLPQLQDTSKGFWTRVLLLTFDRSFNGEAEGDDPDRSRAQKLQKHPRALLLWALEGARRLLAQGGYTDVQSSREAESEWSIDADPVKRFVLRCCSQVGETKATPLHRAYARWAQSEGVKPMSQTKFGRRLRALGIGKDVRMDASYYAVKVKDEKDWYDYAGIPAFGGKKSHWEDSGQ